MCTVDARARNDDAVVFMRGDPEPRKMRARAGRRKRLYRTRVGQRCDALDSGRALEAAIGCCIGHKG
jgi:hypothetical protein